MWRGRERFPGPRPWDILYGMTGFPLARSPGRPLLAWHRGASGRELENSPAAFSLAVAEGADLVEFDVRLSADGDPVVIHDGRTGRTARENLPVSRTSSARLRRLKLKNGEPLPFLADVLEIVGGKVPINLEVKDPGGAEASLRTLVRAGYRGELLFSSGLRAECASFRVLRPDLPCGLVTGRPSASDVAFCLRHSLSSIHPDHRKLTVLRIRKVLASGLVLLPYTVDDPDRFLWLAERGARGVFSNRPAVLRDAWERRRQSPLS